MRNVRRPSESTGRKREFTVRICKRNCRATMSAVARDRLPRITTSRSRLSVKGRSRVKLNTNFSNASHGSGASSYPMDRMTPRMEDYPCEPTPPHPTPLVKECTYLIQFARDGTYYVANVVAEHRMPTFVYGSVVHPPSHKHIRGVYLTNTKDRMKGTFHCISNSAYKAQLSYRLFLHKSRSF